jgi:hypothetical protein
MKLNKRCAKKESEKLDKKSSIVRYVNKTKCRFEFIFIHKIEPWSKVNDEEYIQDLTMIIYCFINATTFSFS